MNSSGRKIRLGFTLVELLTVTSIVGALLAMLMPAIQAIRESARRSSCQNNLRQVGLALINYESAFQAFPSGGALVTQFSWAARSLPFLEQSSVYQQLDFHQDWDAPVNRSLTKIILPSFQCPSSQKDFDGLTDYSGIAGSWLSASPSLLGSRNGMLFEELASDLIPVRTADVVDGLSQTLIVAESAYLLEDSQGWWACGSNCLSHDDGGINNPTGHATEIASFHNVGAYAALCDGAVVFLTNHIQPNVIGAYCTRGQGDLLFD